MIDTLLLRMTEILKALFSLTVQPKNLKLFPCRVYRTIGGILDFYVFLGPSPEEVVQQYTEAVGRYYIPPYWSLCYHQCRWGYNRLDNMKSAWNRTVSNGIPVDAQWGDIDIMDRKLDFTVDGDNFEGLSEFVTYIKQDG